MLKYILIHPSDNVVVALTGLTAGETISHHGQDIRLMQDVPAGHKITVDTIRKGQDVVKYGYPIGHVIRDIAPGQLVDDRVLKTNLQGLDEYTYSPTPQPQLHTGRPVPSRTFRGFVRRNGEVGIRNELWIVPTVGCVNGVAERLARIIDKVAPDYGIDCVMAYTHNYGCSQLGQDHENTRRILRDVVLHPNAGGVLVVGLGCENNQAGEFMKTLGDYDHERIRMMICQDEEDEIGRGTEILKELCAVMAHDRRTEVPLSKLRIGLKCGGSDGLSGITANPLLGVFSDFLVRQGGTTVLTEVPEMFGAETILMNRCKDQDTFRDTVALINDFKLYFMKHDQPVSENPSPGNKAGGISTLEEKSLGCVQKSGSAKVYAVLRYGDRLHTAGLNLLNAPGNDLVASTALAAAGCHIVLFTTGRGTPFGTFVPTVKVSTQTALAEKKANWIDFNAGTLVEGEAMTDVLERFIGYVIGVADGNPTRNETNGYREIAIFKSGITL